MTFWLPLVLLLAVIGWCYWRERQRKTQLPPKPVTVRPKGHRK